MDSGLKLQSRRPVKKPHHCFIRGRAKLAAGVSAEDYPFPSGKNESFKGVSGFDKKGTLWLP
jgi:hypothetical protein